MKKLETEEERKAFKSGACYLKHYIAFCISNYVYKFNFGGLKYFFCDLCDFLKGANYIPNTRNNMSFEKFCEQYTVDK